MIKQVGEIMNQNDNNKTKAELMRELDEIRKKSSKCENELSIAHREVEKLEIQLQSAQKERDKFSNELNKANSKLKHLDELENMANKYRTEKESLATDLKAAEDIISEQTTNHEQETKTFENEKKALEAEIEELTFQLADKKQASENSSKLEQENQSLKDQIEAQKISIQKAKEQQQELSELKKQLAEAKSQQAAEGPQPSDSTFVLELEEKQGEIQGSISHPASAQQKAISGLDGATILGFLEEQLASKSKKKEAKAVPVHEPAAEQPVMTQIDVVDIRSQTPSKAIKHDRPYKVHLNVNLADTADKPLTNVFYNASVYAKALSGGQRILVGTVKDMLKTPGEFWVTISPNTLTPGPYRFETAVVFSLGGKKQQPISAYQESSVIMVK